MAVDEGLHLIDHRVYSAAPVPDWIKWAVFTTIVIVITVRW